MNAAIWIGIVLLGVGALTPLALFSIEDTGVFGPLYLSGYFLWPTFVVLGLLSTVGGIGYKFWRRRND